MEQRLERKKVAVGFVVGFGVATTRDRDLRQGGRDYDGLKSVHDDSDGVSMWVVVIRMYL